MNIFISWANADREIKNRLTEKLQEAGFSCWDSDEECTTEYSAECIAAIERCSLYIVIVSDASMKSSYMLNEIIAARHLEKEGKLHMLVYKTTDAPYSDAFAFHLGHITAVSGNFVQCQEKEMGLDQIVARAKMLLNA